MRPLKQLINSPTSTASRDPRINKAQNVVTQSQSTSPVDVTPIVKIKSEHTIDRAQLSPEILDVRTVSGSIEQILNSLDNQPRLSFSRIANGGTSHLESPNPEMLGRSPLVRRSHNPVFIQQSSVENVRDALAMHPHRAVSSTLRETAQKIGYSLSREKVEPYQPTLESQSSSSAEFSASSRPASAISNASCSVETQTESTTVEREMQTSDNTLDYFITAENLARLSKSDLQHFHELRKRMGLVSKTTLSDLMERNVHRIVNRDHQNSSRDEREAFLNPPAPISAPRAPVFPKRNNNSAGSSSSASTSRYEPYPRYN